MRSLLQGPRPTLRSAGEPRRSHHKPKDDSSKIVILGGGITGLTLAWELSKRTSRPIIIIEKKTEAGGLAGSFTKHNQIFDFGSHRIHEQYDVEVFKTIQDLLGDELLKRPRRGQIRIQKTFLDYPPSIFQILTSFSLRDELRIVRDYLRASCYRFGRSNSGRTFEEYAVKAVGSSLYERFYKPYAIKLWGVPPNQLSAEPAISRVKKFQLPAAWKEAKSKVIRGAPVAHYFYYPARGFGQIAEVIKTSFLANGGEIQFGQTVESFEMQSENEIKAIHVTASDGNTERIEAGVFVSTVPIEVLNNLVQLERDGVDPPLNLSWRSLRILYLFTSEVVPSLHETYYFPEPDVLFGRVSEPAKYSPLLDRGEDRNALSIEVPCTAGDHLWNMSDDELAARCIADLRRTGILSGAGKDDAQFFSHPIKDLYPVYQVGWREELQKALERFERVKNLYSIGRQALFLHCNVDHCMVMAFKLARFLSSPDPRRSDWKKEQEEFFRFALHD